MTDDRILTPDQTAGHERLLLACALVGGPDVTRELLALVQAPMIADAGLSRAWSALRRVLATEAGPVDLVDAVAAELAGESGDAPTLGELHTLAAAVPATSNATYYAQRVRQSYARRELERIAPPTLLERGANLSTAALASGVEAKARRLVELASGTAADSVVRSAADFADTPQPAPVLWRDDPSAPDSTDVDAVLSVGEVAILASAGGLGKSTLVLELASVAVAAAELGTASLPACGLAVAAGPVVLVSFEDAPVRIAHRLTWMNRSNVPAAVHLVPDPVPLWLAADGGSQSHPGAQWDALWRTVRELGARLVVIDPVSAALADVSTTETGPVRAFLRALTAEAEAAGAGALLVAHDTKAARNAVAKGEDPGAGVVAGSAAWYDGARGVLALIRDPVSDDRLLECVKANYGRTGWGARLIERTGAGGTFRGLELLVRLDRGAMAAAKRATTTETAHKRSEANSTGTVPAQDLDSV